MMSKLVLIIYILQLWILSCLVDAVQRLGVPLNPSTCSVASSTVNEIQGFQSVANRIFTEATQGSFKGKTRQDLETLCAIGPRFTGTSGQNRAIEHVHNQMQSSGFSNVHYENVNMDGWIRGREELSMTKPTVKQMRITGMGFSAPTRPGGVTAEALYANDHNFIRQNKEKARGKIIVFDGAYTLDLDETKLSPYANAGVVAIIFRTWNPSTTAYSATAGGLGYWGPNKENDVAYGSTTNQDMDYMVNLLKQGQTVELRILMENTFKPISSRNVVGDLTGREKPDEFVGLSSHTDSWDQSESAQDNGIGVILGIQVPRLLKHLNLVPKRSIRSIFSTGEELGLYGAFSYVSDHVNELSKFSAVLAPDWGCIQVYGWVVAQNSELACLIREIMKLQTNIVPANTASLRVGKVTLWDLVSDVYSFAKYEVPGALMDGDNGQFSVYRHAIEDKATATDSPTLDKCLAFVATTAYVLAEMSEKVQRKNGPVQKPSIAQQKPNCRRRGNKRASKV